MLGGAALYSGLGRRLPARTWLAGGLAVTTAGFLLMASLLSPAVVFAGAAALGLGNAVVGAVIGVLQVERTAGAVRGRVFSVKTALLMVAAPAGIGLAGWWRSTGRRSWPGPASSGCGSSCCWPWSCRVPCATWSRRSCPMLSGELAELAGVTVRTLRHYHQIGLLPEPPRSAGGYRDYGVGHLVRLLRITRMTALGVPLSALPAVLDDPEAAEELLDELDRQAAAEIERLLARRAGIAALRRSGAPPDLPPEVSAWRSGPAAEVPEDMARYEHEQLVLVGHLLGEDGAAGFAALFGGADSGMAAFAPLTARFYALGPDTRTRTSPPWSTSWSHTSNR
ncbi:MerR family DNA-binding transcriptional regulator [Nocardiopsis sp. ARC36]